MKYKNSFIKYSLRIPSIADVETMLFQYWSTVYDAGPTLKQHKVTISCLLGVTDSNKHNVIVIKISVQSRSSNINVQEPTHNVLMGLLDTSIGFIGHKVSHGEV